MSHQVLATHTDPGREERLLPAPPWVMDGPAGPMIRALSPDGQVYRHQSLALDRLGEGKNLIVSTGPASGKTLVFQAGTMDRLARNPDATALAVYPLRALSQDQLGRWREAARQTGADPGSVRKIDGGMEVRERARALGEARLALMTPDTVHSWLMSYADGNTSTRSEGVNRAKLACRDFIRRLAVIVIDEAHLYEDTLGANMAYLLRRLRAKRQELAPGDLPLLIIAAGAPTRDPAGHMRRLTGLPWDEVAEADNGSPRAPLTVQHIAGRTRGPGSEEDMVRLIGELMGENSPDSCVVFADSRQRAERIAAGAEREGMVHEDDIIPESAQTTPHREELQPGEPTGRKPGRGGMRGVVSAGALEMGIGIPEFPEFTVGVSLGTPPSIQRMKQRAGRTGSRTGGKNPGRFIIVGSPHAFQFEENGLAGYWNGPARAARLHLTNRSLQEMHAECLHAEQDRKGDLPGMEWPEGFSETLQETAGNRDQGKTRKQPKMSGQDPPARRQYPHTQGVRDFADKDFDVHLEGSRNKIAGMPKTEAMRQLYTGAAYLSAKQVYEITAWHENGTEENGNPHVTAAPSSSRGRTSRITAAWAAADLDGAETMENRRGMAAYLDSGHATGGLAVIGYRALEPDGQGEARWVERLYADPPGTPDIRRSVPATAALVRIQEPWFLDPSVRRAVIEALRDITRHMGGIGRGELMTAHENITLVQGGEETPADDAVMLWDRAYGGLGLARILYDNLYRYTAKLLRIARDPSRDTEPPISLITASLLHRWASELRNDPDGDNPDGDNPDGDEPDGENQDADGREGAAEEETEHAGTVFRNRLSAGWAAWFDWRGVAWEHEPAAFGDWTPDFRIRVRQQTRYVQVAPVDAFPREAAEWINTSPWAGTAMIVGLGPDHMWVRERGRWQALEKGSI